MYRSVCVCFVAYYYAIQWMNRLINYVYASVASVAVFICSDVTDGGDDQQFSRTLVGSFSSLDNFWPIEHHPEPHGDDDGCSSL